MVLIDSLKRYPYGHSIGRLKSPSCELNFMKLFTNQSVHAMCFANIATRHMHIHLLSEKRLTAVQQSPCLDICKAANAIETKKGIRRECRLLNLVWSQVRPLSLITTTIPWSTRH